MTQTNQSPSLSQLVVAGASAEGHGVLCGWWGRGSLSLADVRAILAEADLPADWAPAARSAVAHAGASLSHPGAGLVVRRAESARRRDGRRDYAARWVVVGGLDAAGDPGELAGRVRLVAEIRDGSDELHISTSDDAGARALAARVAAGYRARRDAEALDASDVSDWLAGVLQRRLGGARLGKCWYVPAPSRQAAARLVGIVSARWGSDWMPCLPVATSEELAQGLVRGFAEEVEAVGAALDRERQDAGERGAEEISTRVAQRLLRELDDLSDRAAGYAALCGDAAVGPLRARVREMGEVLRALAGGAAARFALLEMGEDRFSREVVEDGARAVSRAADEALEARRATARKRQRDAESTEPARELELDLDPCADPSWIPPALRAPAERWALPCSEILDATA